MQPLVSVVVYGGVAAASMIVGGIVGAYRRPSAQLRSYAQHVAAGFVFAAAAVDVLPEVMRRDRPVATAVGFAAGLALTLTIRLLSEKFGGTENIWSFTGVLVADLLIDGLLIGVTTVWDDRQGGLLVAVAVSVELLALGLSMAAILHQATRARVIGVTSATAVLPFVGALVGYFVGGSLGPGLVEGTLAFAVAVFLFMAAEELLSEAHETPETPVGTSLFFVAFLLLLLLDMVRSLQ